MNIRTRRSKIILAIAGIVIVVVVAGGYLLAANAPADLPLFGTTGTYLDPPSLCVNPGSTHTLTQKGTVLGVNSWSSGNTAIAIVASHASKTANIKGVSVGETYVKSKGTFFSDTARIIVHYICPQVQEIKPNTSFKAVTSITGGQWWSHQPTIANVGSDGTVFGRTLGTAWISYGTPGQFFATITVEVTNTPDYHMSW